MSKKETQRIRHMPRPEIEKRARSHTNHVQSKSFGRLYVRARPVKRRHSFGSFMVGIMVRPSFLYRLTQ